MTGSRPTLALVDELTRLLIVPSGVTGCGSLVLGDELTGATSSGSCPARTSMCWLWSTSSLGTLPAGTTEAQVDDMMMVLEVAGEDTQAPIRPRPEWVKISIPLI